MAGLFHLLLANPWSVVAVLVLIGVVLTVLSRPRHKPWLARIRPKPLLTPNEAEFFQRLQRALPAYHVFPQVSFAALLTDDGQRSSRERWAVRARFDRKIADFVICARSTLTVVALIELDDRSHNATADRERDALTKAAGYATFRFQSRQKPTEAEIAALFPQARSGVIG